MPAIKHYFSLVSLFLFLETEASYCLCLLVNLFIYNMTEKLFAFSPSAQSTENSVHQISQ